MGARGPKPKPTALKLIEGNPGKRPLNTAEPQISGGTPLCPEHLPESARQLWQTIMASTPPGMIAVTDAPLLADYCVAWAIHREATEALRKSRNLLGESLLVEGAPSPYLKIINDQAKIMASLASHLGLSPAARGGLKLWQGDGKGGGDGWDDFR